MIRIELSDFEQNFDDLIDRVANGECFIITINGDDQAIIRPYVDPVTSNLEREIDRLREDCAEAYQVVAALATAAGNDASPGVVKALDNLHAAVEGEPRPHDDVLPFTP